MCLDIDDTLLDNAASSRLGLVALVGNDAGWPVWQRASEQAYERFVAGEIDFDGMRIARTRAFFAAFGEDIGEAEAERREARRLAAMHHAWRLFDDAVPCLDWLRASGLRIAVVTNAPSAYQREKIASLGLADAFDAVVISGECGAAKPDPRIFQAACSALGTHPREVVHVGDRLDTDAAGACRAGLHGVWLNRSGRADTPPENVRTITCLAELPELLTCGLPVPLGSSGDDWHDSAGSAMTSADVAPAVRAESSAGLPAPRGG